VRFPCDSSAFLLAHSMNDLMQSRGVRRPSVCLSVRLSVCKLLHASCYFYHKHDSIATKLAHDGPHMVVRPGCAQRQGQGQRSRDTDTFLFCMQVASSTTNMTGSPPNLHNVVPTRACIQGVLKVKVKVKGHVIRNTDTFLITRKSLLLPQT